MGRGASGDYQLLHEFRERATDGRRLEFVPETPLTDIQVIRVETTEGPSWVAWHEIEVIASSGQ